jgi:hypothetical protein
MVRQQWHRIRAYFICTNGGFQGSNGGIHGMNGIIHGTVTCMLLAILAAFFLGCMANENEAEKPDFTPHDSLQFVPVSARNSYLPIEIQGEYGFRHLDFNDKGEGTLLGNGYRLHVEKKSEGLYGWSFNDEFTGILLRRKTMAPIDSSGIYIVGSFVDDSLTLGREELWIPQILSGGTKTWEAYGRRMTLVSGDSVLWLPCGLDPRQRKVDPYTGRVRIEAAIVREDWNGITTFYAFAEGIGLVAYEQKIGDTLLAMGTIELGMALYGGSVQIWP